MRIFSVGLPDAYAIFGSYIHGRRLGNTERLVPSTDVRQYAVARFMKYGGRQMSSP